MSRAIALSIGIVVAAGMARGATLDQSQELGIGATTISEGATYAQTFTAGVTGTLDSVELSIEGMNIVDPSYPTTVRIAEAPGGVPSGSVLATVTGHEFSLGWSVVDFSSDGAALTAGSMYAILLSNDDADTGVEPTVVLRANWEGDVYGDGAFWRNSGDGWNYFAAAGESGLPTGSDMAFRTYVTPIPEPAALVLLAVGAVVLGRRR